MAAAVNNTKVVVESQVNTQPQLSSILNLNHTTSLTPGINYKIEEEKHEAAPNPSSSSTSPVHQPASTLILTPEEDTITCTTAATDIERQSTVNDNQEITEVIPDDHHNDRTNKSDGGRVMSNDAVDGFEELYEAAKGSNWKVASKFLEKNPEAITKVIASDERTVLHVAVIEGNLKFIEEIVKLMPKEILEYKTRSSGYTALHYAALCGYAKAAEVLVKRNRNLTQIEDRCGRVPLYLAIISVTGRQKGTVEYLYSMTRQKHPSPFSGKKGDALLCGMIDAGFYDIASSLVQRFPELVVDQAKKIQISAMNNMAERPFAFASGAQYKWWQRRIYPLVKVDMNTTCEFDNPTNQNSSEENLLQSLEGTNGDEENPIEIFEKEKPPEKLENSEGDEEFQLAGAIVALAIVGVFVAAGAIIYAAIWLIFHLIKLLYNLLVFLVRFIIPCRPPVVKVEKNLDGTCPQNLEGPNADEENLFGGFEGSCTNENTTPEKSANTQEEEDEWYAFAIKAAVYLYLPSSLMIECFLFFPARLIWTPVTRIKQLREQLHHGKVKHQQAKVLVRTIFTTLKERKNEGEIEDFFAGSDVMKMAIKHGSVEIVEVCTELFPQLIWTQMGGRNMIQMAIAERNETILDLLCKTSGNQKIDLVSRCDVEDNTILHYAAKLAPSAQLNSVRGAYLQMQREKQWFKGVENMIPEKDIFKRNKDGDTAHNIFTEEHKELKEKGEKWLKDTSGSCMLVAALIATVAFTSAFTVPGGNTSGDSNSSNNGFPVFLKKDPFIVFAVADALSLFSSITSVIMFLSIYTSRYAEVDFLESLPNKLILGLATLFISMASVLVAFGASFLLMLGERYKWAFIPIVVLSCVPVTLFGWFQLPLFLDMIASTYRGSLFREHTYISSVHLNSKKGNHYKKLVTFINSFGKGSYLEKLVSKQFNRSPVDGNCTPSEKLVPKQFRIGL